MCTQTLVKGFNMKTKSIGLRGFTLVELLVVVTVISVLVALLVPAVTSSRQKAHTIKCLGQLREWGTAFSAYQSDNNGQFPAFPWYVSLSTYVGLEKFWEAGSTVSPRPGDKSLYSCPAASGGDFGGSTGKISYAMNNQIHVGNRTAGEVGTPTLRRSHLSKPASFAVLFDAKTATAYGGATDLLLRHGRSSIGNMLFADGSVMSVTNRINNEDKIILWDPVDAL